MLVVQHMQIIIIVMQQVIYIGNNMVINIVMELLHQIIHYVIQMIQIVLQIVQEVYHVIMYYTEIIIVIEL